MSSDKQDVNSQKQGVEAFAKAKGSSDFNLYIEDQYRYCQVGRTVASGMGLL